MASINKVIIIGNVGRDPETSYLPGSQKAVTNISVATTEKWTDKNTGEKREETEWHRVVFFGSQAETIARYVNKGTQLYIEGKIKTHKYDDNNGITRYSTSINAINFQFLGSPTRNITPDDVQQNQFVPGAFTSFNQQAGKNQPNQRPVNQQTQQNQKSGFAPSNNSQGIDDDIPF
jgi:single-strand DNA-binding protein